MSIEHSTEMRQIMTLVETYAPFGTPAGMDIQMQSPAESDADPGLPGDAAPVAPLDERALIIEALRETVFKLRSYTENDDGERALGVEEGMQRAAEIIENLLRRHGDTELG